jgi:hypothetical protein
MTPEERVADIMSRYKSGEHGFAHMLDWLGLKIETAITAAVDQERERCAARVEEMSRVARGMIEGKRFEAVLQALADDLRAAQLPPSLAAASQSVSG